MFLPFSAINTLFIKHQDENLFWKAVSQLYLINAGFYNIICQCRVREKFSDLPLTGLNVVSQYRVKEKFSDLPLTG
jgi:hypothetical protein